MNYYTLTDQRFWLDGAWLLKADVTWGTAV